MVPLAVLLGSLFGLGGLGSTAVAVVLPEVADALGVSVATSTWLISLYALTMAISTPVYGRLVDVAGVRVPLLVGVGLMSLGALLAATATNFPVMLLARLLQGFGTGAGPTLAVAVIGTRFAYRDRSRGLAVAAGIAGAIGATGPLIGGFVDSLISWRGATALPAFGLVVLGFLWRRVRGGGTGGGFDVAGAVLVALASGGVIMLLQSPSSGAVVAILGGITTCLTAPFAVLRSKRARAFLPASVLLNGRILCICLAAGLSLAAWLALLVTVPSRLAENSWSPVDTGLALVPSAAVAAVVPVFTSRVIARFGPMASLRLAVTMTTAALMLAAVSVGPGRAVPLSISVAVVTAAFCLGQPSLFTIVSELADPTTRGLAMGFGTLVFLCCGSAGVAVVGGLSPVPGLWSLTGLAACGLVYLLFQAASYDRGGVGNRGPHGHRRQQPGTELQRRRDDDDDR